MPAPKMVLCRRCGEMFADPPALEAHRVEGRCLSEKMLKLAGFRRNKYERWQLPKAEA